MIYQQAFNPNVLPKSSMYIRYVCGLDLNKDNVFRLNTHCNPRCMLMCEISSTAYKVYFIVD